MSNTKQTTNPFDYLPEEKLQIIRDDFYKDDISKSMNFKQYLKALHEEDDLIPEEVLDIIESQNSDEGKTFSTAKELLEELHKDD